MILKTNEKLVKNKLSNSPKEGLTYFEVSAKSNYNIKEIFKRAAEMYVMMPMRIRKLSEI
jgi:hypothetical protein